MHRTRIVCTLGPACRSREVLAEMVRAGMDVARLNFSHGTFEEHGRAIEDVRAVARAAGRDVAILADLPGPKIRLGRVVPEPFDLVAGAHFTLTTEEIVGDRTRAHVSFPPLPREAKPGDTIFVNDGFVQLEVVSVDDPEVRCVVRVGGEIRSRKGVNLPGIRLGAGAFTEDDRRCLEFALAAGADVIGQSFVEGPDDIEAVRAAARALGREVFVIAKIERAAALERIDAILEAADGIMVARGDLGVEIPIERIALVQKDLIRRANRSGKPVITATQMLESMTGNPRPTRAEATDVANAILDGTDAVMLSGESAVGRYPVEAVRMLARIAAATEPAEPAREIRDELRRAGPTGRLAPHDILALAVAAAAERAAPAAVIVPTLTGATARSVARFRLPLWITAVTPRAETARRLLLTRGVAPVLAPEPPSDWTAFAREWTAAAGVEGDLVLLTEGPSKEHPDANHRMEILRLS